jgi:hypothetical protein
MNAQSLIHWLEQGRGAQALKVLAVLLVLLAISVTVAFKQFHGPRTEETLRQADLGRSLAEGKGFTSSINYPQVQATLERRGRLFSQQQAMPEVYHAPGYAMVVAATLALLPDGMYQSAFKAAPKPPDGFGADYVLLGLNILLLWIAAGQTWRLGAKLFESRVGLLAGGVVLISSPIWAHVVAVDGTALAMVFLLAFFQFLMRGDDAVERGESGRGAWIGVGVVAGLLFLTDYPWGMLAVVAGVHAGIRGRLSGAFWVLGVALLVVSPWLIRNVEVIGSPLALAGQDLALRADDPTANPVEWRNTLTSKAPEVSLNKLGNKTLSALKQTLSEQLWAEGGMILTAFFVTGWIYRFRREGTNRLRTLFAVSLGVMILAHGLMNSGEGERLPVTVAAPLVILFGVGFFTVLVASSPSLREWPRLAAMGLLGLQGLPLIHDLAEPRRIHFSYPPYFPSFFMALGDDIGQRAGPVGGWMADVPAGAAWYSGRRVWSQPASLRDFYAVHVEQPVLALVLTPETLDRPFFAELAGESNTTSRFGEWGKIYTGLLAGRLPQDFPLTESRRMSGNLYLLMDPAWSSRRGK